LGYATSLSLPTTRLTLAQAVRLFFRFNDARLHVLLIAVLATLRLRTGHLSLLDLVWGTFAAATWPFVEWFLHRYLMHMKPIRVFGRTVDPFFARNHRLHHHSPLDVSEVFWSWPAAVVEAAVSFGAAWLVLQRVDLAITVSTALVAMTLNYNWIHFLVHTSYGSRSPFYRGVWRAHRLHHFKNENFWFAFTIPALDRWLGTGPDDKDVPRLARTDSPMTDDSAWQL
jgi:hypothetical protein